MSKPEIVKKTPITIAELKNVLKNIKKRDEELTFRGNKAEDYANHVCSLNKKQSEELRKNIQELNIPRIKEEHIVKIIDTLPKTPAELKVVMQGYTVSVTNDNLKKIVDVVVSSI